MYYVLAATLALLIFVLFIKALGAVIRGTLTTLFVLVIIGSLVIMFRSLKGPVDIFGVYRVDKFEITKFGE
jgi:hypothetical protein